MTKRWMLYAPEIEPNSFFFFFYKGSSGRSYSVRTYTSANTRPRHRTHDHFPYTADEILDLAQHGETVRGHNVNDSAHWWAITRHLNTTHLGHAAAAPPHTMRRKAARPPATPTTSSCFHSSQGTPLLSMADWQAQHPARHWRAGYSAMELARTWSSAGGLPESFQQALGQPPFEGLVLERGVVEHNTDVPGRGRASCTDLMVTARTPAGTKVVIGVEGKVDETFGPLVAEWLTKGGANRQDRLDGLCEALGLEPMQVGALRYQLFHRTYAALATASEQRCSHAVLAIHSLEGRGSWGDNWQSFVAFARALGATNVDKRHPTPVGVRMGVDLWLLWVTEPAR